MQFIGIADAMDSKAMCSFYSHEKKLRMKCEKTEIKGITLISCQTE